MFASNNEILHACVFGFLRPGSWVIEVRVEVVEILLIVGVVD
jgi:hypothetical protein